MMLRSIVWTTLFLSGFVSSQDDIDCFVPGKCLNSETVGISFTPDAYRCLTDCKDNPDCLYFSYEFDDDLCAQLTECTELVVTDPQENTAGNVNCDATACSEIGQCEGNLLDHVSTANEEDCIRVLIWGRQRYYFLYKIVCPCFENYRHLAHLEEEKNNFFVAQMIAPIDLCMVNLNCLWYSFNTVHSACTILSDCDTVDHTSLDTVYGQKECQNAALTTPAIETTTPYSGERRPTLLVMGGTESYDIDVIDLDGRVCDAIPSVPGSSQYNPHFGFVKDEGSTPVFCLTDKCSQFTGDGWSNDYIMDHGHNGGAGAQFDDDTYLITGGSSGGNYTDYWSTVNDGFLPGPPTPEPVTEHCMVALNSTHAYIAGGPSGLNSAGIVDAYVFDRNTQEYTALPDMPHSHYRPACGIAQTSNGPEFVVVGMYSNDYVEIYNIEQGYWRMASERFPGSITTFDTGYVQWEDSFLVVGDDENIYEYIPATEVFVTRVEKTSQHTGYIFLLLIDGTRLNCV